MRAVDVARRSAIPGARDGERSRSRCEREHRSREDAEPCGARSPPQEHDGGPYSTERYPAPAAWARFPERCAKLQHFRDGSPCERPPGLLPSCACDGREDVIARAAAVRCALGTSDRPASGRPARGLRPACPRGPDQRETCAGPGCPRAAAAPRCGGSAREQRVSGGEPEAAAGGASASDQPPGARRRARQLQPRAAHAREAARRDVHVPGPAVLARRPPRRAQPRRPHLPRRGRELAVEAGHRAHPAGRRVPAPDRAPADDAAQRTPPAAPARRRHAPPSATRSREGSPPSSVSTARSAPRSSS